MKIWATVAMSVLACLLAGCGRKQAPAKDYWDEEARLQTFQAAVEMLRDNARKPAGFAAQQDAGRSDFAAALSMTIGTAENFSKFHSGSDNAATIKELLTAAREVEALKATAPSPQLTAKLDEMAERSSKLLMRPMTKEEEASIQKSIK